MFTTKLNLVAPLAFAVLCVTAASIEPALAGTAPVPAPLAWRWRSRSGDSQPADTGSFASFVGAVREPTMGELKMFTTKLNLVAPLAFAVLCVTAASIEPALAGAVVAPVPAPLLGAGAPALAILAGGYWLIRKFRGRR